MARLRRNRPVVGDLPPEFARFRPSEWIDYDEPVPADIVGREQVWIWRAVRGFRRYMEAKADWKRRHGHEGR